MPFEIGFTASSKTKRAKAMLEGVIRAVDRTGAVMDLKTQAVRLPNGEEIHLDIAPSRREMLITAQSMSPELNRFAYALSDETATIILSDGLSAAAPSAGEPPMYMVGQITIDRLKSEEELEDQLRKAFLSDKASDEKEARREARFQEVLARRRAEIAAGAAAPKSASSLPRTSILKRLSDALFGKAI